MPYNAFQTMSLCLTYPITQTRSTQRAVPHTVHKKRAKTSTGVRLEYLGLLTGRDEKCHCQRQISCHSPKKSWGLPPKITGTETSENQTTKIKRKYTPQLEPSSQKSQYAYHCRGVFCSLSHRFLSFGPEKNIAHHGTTVLACRQPQSAHHAASASWCDFIGVPNRRLATNLTVSL